MLNIQSIRRVGAKDSKSLNSIFLNPHKSESKTITKEGQKIKDPFMRPLKQLSLRDLTAAAPVMAKKTVRPGTRPDVTTPKKAIEAVSLKGNEQMRKFIRGADAVALSGDTRGPGMNNTDVMVSLEVPEGVNPDELNEYELMFYSFQRRTATNYINSFFKNLEEFQSKNPHLKFPMTDTKQMMTGRLTYDKHGNIKQIKMIRWSNVTRLQDFFVEVLKDMDTLHNPPTALWEKNNDEFSIFFSLAING